MYLSSVLGISLSKVCKVVLSPCLCINKCVCHNYFKMLPLYKDKACFVNVNSNAKGSFGVLIDKDKVEVQK